MLDDRLEIVGVGWQISVDVPPPDKQSLRQAFGSVVANDGTAETLDAVCGRAVVRGSG